MNHLQYHFVVGVTRLCAWSPLYSRGSPSVRSSADSKTAFCTVSAVRWMNCSQHLLSDNSFLPVICAVQPPAAATITSTQFFLALHKESSPRIELGNLN
ncbi:hypothetical protein GDO78_016160 [Eleutherodactylus coqui]|uniref:Uncharacterized protein n=1 Tax=Eleutherodactylus coqui TaxID=57060 RepID=A0A8J6EKJ3_ELECQ|nr:hypothetical protein GDO78_016160 [Eleutherodactylus coqui]